MIDREVVPNSIEGFGLPTVTPPPALPYPEPEWNGIDWL